MAFLLTPAFGFTSAQQAYADEFETAQTSEESVINGGFEIDEPGTYTLAEDATGIISIITSGEVIIQGVAPIIDAETLEVITPPYKDLSFDCTNAPLGAHLTLKDMYTEVDSSTVSYVDFSGAGNVLKFEGLVISNNNYGAPGNPAAIHVPPGAELTIGGTGTLYLFKGSGGAGIGGDGSQLNGNIIFGATPNESPGLSAFIKGTYQGAVIGAGRNTGSITDKPGTITFNSGTYQLVSNSRGAVIGGASSSGGNIGSAGTEVYFNGGSISINVDYSGAAVGGGGKEAGNITSGGQAYFSGGSLRVYTNLNAAGGGQEDHGGGWGDEFYGVNDRPITAQKLDAEGQAVSRAQFDTTLLDTPATTFTAYVDNSERPFFVGGMHNYFFVNEKLIKEDQENPDHTPQNWIPRDQNDPETAETNLYFYLANGKNHDVYINGERYTAIWISAEEGEGGTFNVIKGKAELVSGDFDDDGILSITDAMSVVLYVLTETEPTAEQLAVADFDDDGILSISDALSIVLLVLAQE